MSGAEPSRVWTGAARSCRRPERLFGLSQPGPRLGRRVSISRGERNLCCPSSRCLADKNRWQAFWRLSVSRGGRSRGHRRRRGNRTGSPHPQSRYGLPVSSRMGFRQESCGVCGRRGPDPRPAGRRDRVRQVRAAAHPRPRDWRSPTPPTTLNLALVDFKGGATFAGLAPLPHVAALITNLADDEALVDRMQDALGASWSVARSSWAGTALSPRPDTRLPTGRSRSRAAADASRGGRRVLRAAHSPPRLHRRLHQHRPPGRSLGVHLLLASQRLEEGRLRGLESHLSYRIALRTFSAADSRAVLAGPEAFDLPPEPGSGLLQTDQGLLRFRAAYVSGPAPPQAPATTTSGALHHKPQSQRRPARPRPRPRRSWTPRCPGCAGPARRRAVVAAAAGGSHDARGR